MTIRHQDPIVIERVAERSWRYECGYAAGDSDFDTQRHGRARPLRGRNNLSREHIIRDKTTDEHLAYRFDGIHEGSSRVYKVNRPEKIFEVRRAIVTASPHSPRCGLNVRQRQVVVADGILNINSVLGWSLGWTSCPAVNTIYHAEVPRVQIDDTRFPKFAFVGGSGIDVC